MKIDPQQPSPHRAPSNRMPQDGVEVPSWVGVALRRPRSLRACGGSGVLLALLLACGGSSEDAPLERGGCASAAECSDGQQCIDSLCVVQSSPSTSSAGVFACSVINCPPSQPSCCMTAEASATGNESQDYVVRNEMVERTFSFPGEVRANFSFDASDQQGWVTFQLGAELDLERLDFTGRVSGVADRFLSVNTNRSSDTGCSFGFELELRPPPSGQGPFLLGNDNILINDNGFCYGNGNPRPGRARELAFAIFSLQPGDASLIITNLTLHE